MWNKDEIQGKAKEIKGNMKNKIGEVTGDQDLKAEGDADRTAGKVQNTFGKAKRKVGEKVEEIGEKIGHGK